MQSAKCRETELRDRNIRCFGALVLPLVNQELMIKKMEWVADNFFILYFNPYNCLIPARSGGQFK